MCPSSVWEVKHGTHGSRRQPTEACDPFADLSDEERLEAVENLRQFLAILREWDSKESGVDISRD